MKRTIHLIVPVLALLMLTPGLFAQENAQTDGEAQPNASEEPAQPAETAGGGGGLGFGMGLTFGVSSFENPDTGEVETYQLLALRPEFVLGNFGLGLDLPVRPSNSMR